MEFLQKAYRPVRENHKALAHLDSRGNETHVKQRYKKHAIGNGTVDSDGEEEVGYRRVGGMEAESESRRMDEGIAWPRRWRNGNGWLAWEGWTCARPFRRWALEQKGELHMRVCLWLGSEILASKEVDFVPFASSKLCKALIFFK